MYKALREHDPVHSFKNEGGDEIWGSYHCSPDDT